MTIDRPPAELPVIRPLPGTAPRARDDQQIVGTHWRITVLTTGLVRIEYSPDGGFEDRASTFAIRRDLPAVSFTVERAGDGVVLETERMRLRYDGAQFSPQGFVVEVLGPDARRWRYGESTRDLGGTARTLDDIDGRVDLDPGIISRYGVGVIDDSASFLFDDDGQVATRTPGRRDLYVFAYGRDFEATVQAFYQVSGPAMLLPRWALGNWWSRYHAYTSESYLALMDRFRAEDLPFSVAVIDMDWHRVDSVPPRFGDGWTGYSWEPELIPDPPAFLAALHERGMRTTLNLHPADGVRAFEDAYPDMARALGVDPATEAPIPFDPTDPAFLRAYFEYLHHPLEAQGVDFWWIDWQQGHYSGLPGVDPLWLLNHFHHLDAARAGGPGMTFSRYAGPGSHRYAVGFSGDAVISWRTLDFQPEFTATAANIGYGWWSHDIGGHTVGTRDDELATRWVQFGVFSPIMRLHSTRNPFIRKEPWTFGPEYRAAMGEALRLRHRLVPYLHTMNHRAAAGIPLVRPMYHLAPRRDEAFTVPNEYEFGSQLIVAPITTPRAPASLMGSVRVWLPEGTWTDVFTDTVYRGDRCVELRRTVESIPVLLRAGGILPLAAADDLDVTRNPERLEVLVAPAASGEFELAEDVEDASGLGGGAGGLAAGERAAGGPASTPQGRSVPVPAVTTRLAWDADAGEFRVGAGVGRLDAIPVEREWTLTFLALLPDGEVTIGRGGAGGATVDSRPVAVEGHRGRWSVHFSAPADSETVVRVGALRVGPDRTDAIRELLARAQMADAAKVAVWDVVISDRSAAERIAELGAIDVPGDVRAAVTELLSATVA